MPLPDNGLSWPPVAPAITSALADWSAWYSGDPDQIGQRYLNRGTAGAQNRPSQYRGGVVGRFARWFWGNPTPIGEKRTKLHIPLAGDIARTSSELLFSEPPKFTAEHTGTQDWLEEQVEAGLHATLLETGEVCAALGGVYPRLVWDREISDRPWIAPAQADGALPVFAYGRLREVVFWTILEQDDQTVIRHLELHTRGAILHGLYEGSPHSLGKRIPLDEFEQTEAFAPNDGMIETGAPGHLTASYIPNMRPARAWRCVPEAAYWGQSDFAGIEGLMDALDETYSSLMRDIRLAKGRIVVPNAYLRSNGPGQGAAWDEDREVYSGLDMLVDGDSSAKQLTPSQFEIRTRDHLDTAQALLEQAVRQAGYSAASFGEAASEGQAVTATEILARQHRSMSTRAKKILYADTGLGDIIEAKMAIESGPLFGVSGLEVGRPRIEWPDSVQEGTKTLAETAGLLSQAEAASKQTLVELVHPDWDETQVREEVALIRSESAMADPMASAREPLDGDLPE